MSSPCNLGPHSSSTDSVGPNESSPNFNPAKERMDYLADRTRYLISVEECFCRCYLQTFRCPFKKLPSDLRSRNLVTEEMTSEANFKSELQKTSHHPIIKGEPLDYIETVLAELKNGSKSYQDDNFYRRRFERRNLKLS